MSTFHAFVSICLIVIVALILIAYLALWDYLSTIRNRLFMILENVRPIPDRINDVWSTVLQVRDHTARVKDLLDKDEDEPEETGISDGWTIAPCPVCGGPASMHYDHNCGDGYFVICDKHSKHEGCEYGIVTGGATRKTAAFMWNKSAVMYCNRKNIQTMNDAEET